MDEPRARVLGERLASGALDRNRLALAAYIGSPEARAVLGVEAPRPFVMPDFDRVDWTAECAADFPQFGLEACTRIAVAVGRVALGALTTTVSADEYARILASAAVFARCPCEAHQRAAESIASSHETTELIQSALAGPMEEAVFAVVAAASVAGATSATAAADDLGRLIAFQPEHLQQILNAEVMPWALGEADPLDSSAAPR